MRTNKVIYILIISGICFIISMIIAALPVVREGLELLFLLPLAYAIAMILFSDLFVSWNENVGIAILFGSSLLRYIISPLLMSLSNHSVAYVGSSTQSYRMAIFIMIYELFMVLIILKYVRCRFIRRRNLYRLREQEDNKDSFRVTWIGFLLFVLIIGLLIMRGNLSNVFSHFSYFTTYSEDRSAVYTYDRTFVYLLKSFMFIAIVSKMGRISKNNKSLKHICFLIAIVAALLNSVFYDYTSRSVLVEFIVSSVVVLIYCFPDKRKVLIASFSITGFLLVSSVFLSGTLQTTWSTLGDGVNILQRISEMGELYSNGISTIAHSLDTYESAHQMIGIDTFFSEFFNSIGFITFPGFRSIYYAFANIPTAAAIFMQTLSGKGFILPPIGLALYYGEIFLFLPISILNCYLCIWTLYKIESKKYSKYQNEGTVYIVTYAEIICGMALFVNNISIMIQGLTAIPLLMVCFLWINKLADRIIIRRKY